MVTLDSRSPENDASRARRSRAHARGVVATSWFVFILGAALAGLDASLPRAIGLAAWAAALFSMAEGSFYLFRLGRVAR